MCLHNSMHRVESKLRTSPGALLPSTPRVWFPLVAGLSPWRLSEAFLESSASSRVSALSVVRVRGAREVDQAKSYNEAVTGQGPEVISSTYRYAG